MMQLLNDWKMILLLCLTLGLAPFMPEPHIVGKIRWLAGGAVGMAWQDWLDLVFHGFPWILLLRIGIIRLILPKKTVQNE